MWIEFDCVICGTHVKKRWAKNDPRVPKYCCWDCKSEGQRRTKPITKEWLYQKYIVEEMSANAIAKIVHRDPTRVLDWMEDFGIPTRSRGTAPSSHHYKTGQVSPFKGCTHTPEAKEKIRQKRLEDGHVPYLKGGVHYLKGKRGAETPNWKGGVTPERQAFYDKKEWRALVKQVWKRDRAVCQRCDLYYGVARKKSIQFHIHHIIPFVVKKFRLDLDNLVLLCRPCHLFIHSNENVNKEFVRECD